MVVYSKEGGAMYFDKNGARQCIHGGENLTWTFTMLDKTHPCFFVDNDSASKLESSYFMSIYFNYLPLRCKKSFIIEPYSSHLFSRQFGFYQTSLIMRNDICNAFFDKLTHVLADLHDESICVTSNFSFNHALCRKVLWN